MNLSPDVNPLKVVCRTVASDEPIEWHTHPHDEFCLILEGTPTVGNAGGKFVPQTDTLFLFKEGEMHGSGTQRPSTPASGCWSFVSAPF